MTRESAPPSVLRIGIAWIFNVLVLYIVNWGDDHPMPRDSIFATALFITVARETFRPWLRTRTPPSAALGAVLVSATALWAMVAWYDFHGPYHLLTTLIWGPAFLIGDLLFDPQRPWWRKWREWRRRKGS